MIDIKNVQFVKIFQGTVQPRMSVISDNKISKIFSMDHLNHIKFQTTE
jgi:hypothetical protein